MLKNLINNYWTFMVCLICIVINAISLLVTETERKKIRNNRVEKYDLINDNIRVEKDGTFIESNNLKIE